MTDDSHVLEYLPAYALDCLEQIEARLVAEHLEGCYICRRELSAFQEVAEGLALTVPEAHPSPDLRRRLMEQIQGMNSTQPQPTRGRFLQRLLPVAGIIGLLLIVGFAVSTILLWQRLNNIEVLAGPLGMRAIALQNTDMAQRASGFIVMGADGKKGVLIVDQLPPLDSQREYQLWLVRDGDNTSGAVFSVDESGYRGVRIEAPEILLVYSSVRVTIEPAGGSVEPTGEQVLGGSLFNR